MRLETEPIGARNTLRTEVCGTLRFIQRYALTIVAQPRSRGANETQRAKHRPEEPSRERLIEARRALAVAKLESYIAAVVAAAPPLTDDQRSRLALVLRRTS